MRTLTLFVFFVLGVWSQAQEPPKRPPISKGDSAQAAEQKQKPNERQQAPQKNPATTQHQISSPADETISAANTDEELKINRQVAAFTGQLARFTGRLAWFTLGLVVVGGLQLYALFWQARALTHHSKLIEQSVEQMRQAVVAYQGFVQASQEMLALTRESNDISREGAEAATLSAETTKRALELTERAEIQIREITCSEGLAPPTGETTVAVTIRNYGRTRAIGITPTGSLGICSGSEATPFLDNIPFDLAAQAEMQLVFPPLRSWMSEESVTSLKRNDAFLCFQTRIDYEDVFGAKHVAEANGMSDHRRAWSFTRNVST